MHLLALMPAVADYKQRSALPIEELKQEIAVIEHAAAITRGQRQNPQEEILTEGVVKEDKQRLGVAVWRVRAERSP